MSINKHTHEYWTKSVSSQAKGEEITFPIFLFFLSSSPVSPQFIFATASLTHLLSLSAFSNMHMHMIIKAKEYL